MTNKKVVITGINGFVGEHAARQFKNQNCYIIGVGHDSQPHEKSVSLIDEYISCDLTDADQVNERINLSDVNAVVHLAGLGSVGQSFQQPRRYITDNGLIAYNILQRAADTQMPGRVIVVSTGALFDPKQPLPLTETSTTSPSSPYAIGKLMTEDVTRYFRSRGVDAVIVRPFNHIGPGQIPGFILPDFYEQLLASRETGRMMVGNIDSKRDYTDVRDIVRAYEKLAFAESLQHDVYNLCSGSSLSGRQILELLKETLHIDNVTIEIDQTKIRPNDIMDLYGDTSRLRSEIDWQPEIPIAQTIKDFVASKA